MNITLAEAIPLRKTIERRIYELIQERNSVSVATVEKGETPEKTSRSVDAITEEIYRSQKHLRELLVLISKANIENTLDWDGGKITLSESIELAKQVRSEVEQLKRLGNRKKTERESGRRSLLGDSSSHLLTVALYDPEEYRKKALKLERQANKLSSTIERKNHFIEIPFDASDYID